MKRENYLKMFRENESIRETLDAAKDEKERKAIRAHAEDMFMRMYDDLFQPLFAHLEKDPEAMMKAWSNLQSELIKNAGKDPGKE